MNPPSEIRVEKRFRHPPERVFDAFLDPAHVGRWFFHTPEGVMEKTDYDPVAGGAFAIFERRGDTLARHFGQFVEITAQPASSSTSGSTRPLTSRPASP